MNIIDTISGAVNLFIYEYNHKRYYFFGDFHVTRKNSCYDKGIQCDAFNYNFTNTTNANTSCTTIGALLHNWFIYNNINHIKTDFYLEEYYTKEPEREEDQEYINIIKNRSTVNTRQGAPFKEKSWMQLLPYIMSPCFIPNKSLCPYAPNVHLHYIDVRTIVIKNDIVNITPFSIESILIYMIEHQPTTIGEFIKIRKEMDTVIDFSIDNFKTLLHYLLSNQIDAYKQALLSTNSLYISEQINYIDYFTFNGVFKIAHELQRLQLSFPEMHDRLLAYIDKVIDNIMLKVERYRESIKQSITKYNILKKRKVLHIMGLRHLYEDYIKIINGYQLIFVNLEAILMDIYTLSRMFIQDGDEVIVYAGAYHTKIYQQFFDDFATPLLIIPYTKGTNCLTHPDIPKYIEANKFKNF